MNKLATTRVPVHPLLAGRWSPRGFDAAHEVTDEQVAASRDFRSMSMIVDVDCHDGREKLLKAAAFDQPNLAGSPQPRPVSGEWATPEAYMAEVIKTICALHGMHVVEPTPGSGGALAAAQVPASPAEPPPLPVEPATPDPAPSPPEPAIGSAPTPPPSSYPVPDAAPVTVATATPNRWSSPAAGSGLSAQARVQIASSPSRADAEAKLDRSAALIQSPLRGEVEVATVHGKTVFRSIIAPFASQAEARAFCARTGLTLDGCFVWGPR